MALTTPDIQQVRQGQVLSFEHFIDGAYQPAASGETFEDRDPFTGKVLATVALGGEADIDRAVAVARKTFEQGPWPRMSLRERCEVLRRIGDRILAQADRLALAETLDTGKPITESATGDVPRAAFNFHFFAEFAASLGEDCYTTNRLERHLALREPLGVVGLITPWNLPLYLATWKIAPALAMGNTVVLKPAEWTPFTAALLGGICQEAGLPPGVLNVVHGFGAGGAGEALTRHPDVAAISFTGETSTGKAILKAAAETLKKVSFELGGKGANIVFEDADRDAAMAAAVPAAFRNQGQLCLAGSRLFVQESLCEAFTEQLVARVRSLRLGDPVDPQTQFGPLISREHRDKVLSYLEIARRDGQVACGGSPPAAYPEGFFVEPTVVTNISPDSPVCREEIFGPVLPVIPFKNEAQVLAWVNDTWYGLSASLWSRDVNRCHRLARDIRTGLVWVNCWFARDLRTPFGGQKESGVGREGGRHSLEFFSEAKTVCYRYAEDGSSHGPGH